jgi:hypothetical protein
MELDFQPFDADSHYYEPQRILLGSDDLLGGVAASE